MKRLFAELLNAVFRRKSAGPEPLVSTLTNNRAYPVACLRAATDQQAFDNFRRDPAYIYVLEHVTPGLGQVYAEQISKDSQLMGMLDALKHNDDFGNPSLYEYPLVGVAAPTTLRYIKILADMKAAFKTLDGLRICEIGVGYGGQCRILDACFEIASYRLVDIPPALALARRYLGGFPMRAALSFKTMEELDDAGYDMAISNYAFSELTRSIQREYLSKIILRSKMGYIIYNEIMPPEFNSHKVPELLEMIPGARVLPEVPLTHPKNCVIVWGDQVPA